MGNWKRRRRGRGYKPLPPIKHGTLVSPDMSGLDFADCPNFQGASCWGIPLELPEGGRPDVLFVGLAPRRGDDEKRKPYAGDSGRVLRKTAAFAGYKAPGFTYLSKCRLQEWEGEVSKDLSHIPESVWPACRDQWIREVLKIAPETLVLLGPAVEQLTGLPFNKVRGSWQTLNLVHPDTGETHTLDALCTWDPRYFLSRPTYATVFVDDLRRAKLGRTQYKRPGYKTLTTIPEIHDMLMEMRNAPRVSCDLETENLNRMKNKVATFHFASEVGFGYTVILDHPESPWTPEERNQVEQILRTYFERDINSGPTQYLVGQNWGFDFGVLEGTLGWKLARIPILDTKVLVYLLNENRKSLNIYSALKRLWQAPDGSWRAGGLVQEFLGVETYPEAAANIKDGETMSTPMPLLSEYGAADVCYTLALADQLVREFPEHLRDGYLKLAFHWYSRVIRMVSKMERNGMPVSIDQLRKLRDPRRSPIHRTRADIKKFLKLLPTAQAANEALNSSTARSNTLLGAKAPWNLGLSKDRDLSALLHQRGLTPATPDFQRRVKNIGMNTKVGEGLKKDGTLSLSAKSGFFDKVCGLECPDCGETFSDDNLDRPPTDCKSCHGVGGFYPEFELTQLDRALQKLLGGYIKSIAKWLSAPDNADGFIRPSFLYVDTVTGRTASKDPNAQQLPRGSNSWRRAVRNIYSCPPGWCIVAADLDQAEVGIAGLCSQDDAMGEIFRYKRELTLRYRDNPSPELLKKKDLETDAHRQVASLAFGVPVSAFGVEEDQEDLWRHKYGKKSYKAYKHWLKHDLRNPAKTVTFSILYAKTVRSLAKDLGVDVDEAQRIKDAYFGTFKNLQKWLARQGARVKETYEVLNPFGRTRRCDHLLALPDPNADDARVSGIVAEAVRYSNNAPIQSGASDIFLTAICDLYERIEDEGLSDRMRPMAIVHDDVWAMVRIEDLPLYMRMIQDAFYQVDMSPFNNPNYPNVGEQIRSQYPVTCGFKVGIGLGKQIEVEPDPHSVREAQEALWAEAGLDLADLPDMPEFPAASSSDLPWLYDSNGKLLPKKVKKDPPAEAVAPKDWDWPIWVEGYQAQGGSSPAQLLAVVRAPSFNEALRKLVKQDANFQQYFKKDPQPSYWGLRLFDSEAEARKSFG